MNDYRCPYCGAVFAEDEMSVSDHRDGICPFCGADGVEFYEPPQQEHKSLDKRRTEKFSYKPEAQMNWDEIRKAKLLCRTCANYDHANLGCKLWLIPNEKCPHRIEGVKET